MSTRQVLQNAPYGAVVISHGKGRYLPPYWTPKRVAQGFGIEQVYKQIRVYQHRIYPERYLGTHVRFLLGDGKFFEFTHPVARFGNVNELVDKKMSVYTPEFSFDPNIVDGFFEAQDGKKYDIKELIDFALSGWIGMIAGRLGVVDRKDRFVCSTGIAKAFEVGGCEWELPVNAISPAHYENTELFKLIHTQG